MIGKTDDGFVGGNMGEEGVDAPEADAVVETKSMESPAVVAQGRGEQVFASPRARRTAAAHGIDLAQVEPTGYDGLRIAERDVFAWMEKQPKTGSLTRQEILSLLVKAGEVVSDVPVLERKPLSGVRGVIAERMAESALLTARVTMFMDVDVTDLVKAREGMKGESGGWGFTPGYNDMIALVVARVLGEHPSMNARLTPEAIEYMEPVNIGMAVDTERGLMVPVIRDADKKTLREFGETFRALVEKARSGRISPVDLSGGTFTITNLGMYDVKAFTPVINLPETAILGVGMVAQRPAAYQGELSLRYMTTLSLVFDHRVVDGAPAARFMQAVKRLLEAPTAWL